MPLRTSRNLTSAFARKTAIGAERLRKVPRSFATELVRAWISSPKSRADPSPLLSVMLKASFLKQMGTRAPSLGTTAKYHRRVQAVLRPPPKCCLRTYGTARCDASAVVQNHYRQSLQLSGEVAFHRAHRRQNGRRLFETRLPGRQAISPRAVSAARVRAVALRIP